MGISLRTPLWKSSLCHFSSDGSKAECVHPSSKNRALNIEEWVTAVPESDSAVQFLEGRCGVVQQALLPCLGVPECFFIPVPLGILVGCREGRFPWPVLSKLGRWFGGHVEGRGGLRVKRRGTPWGLVDGSRGAQPALVVLGKCWSSRVPCVLGPVG